MAEARSSRARGRRRLRSALLAAIGALYLVSVPWYREPEAPVATWLGLPDWVAVALVCYAAVAVLNCAAWLVTDLRDPEPGASSRDAAGRPGPHGTRS